MENAAYVLQKKNFLTFSKMKSHEVDLKVKINPTTLRFTSIQYNNYMEEYELEIADPTCDDFKIENSQTGRYVRASGKIGKKILKNLQIAREEKVKKEHLSTIELQKCQDTIITKLPNTLLNKIFQFLSINHFINILASFNHANRIDLAKQYALINRINSQKIVLYFKVITISHEDGYCSGSELYEVNTYDEKPIIFYTMKRLNFCNADFVPQLNKNYTFDGYLWLNYGKLTRSYNCYVPDGSGYCDSYEELLLKKVRIYKYTKDNNNQYSYQRVKSIRYVTSVVNTRTSTNAVQYNGEAI